ncbi:EF-hand domain-containing protein [Bosea sp. 124]|uniref:EF-hand domain-containing protein n=1 Tax=Bosea sp. 124 TaxID=2135642 RepID=UPI000D4146CE|nr:EF-hand domain-containing protein [Bosea sp. 124]PTM43121.1 EF hand domain-containing protein [Bosea sp. 124]
METNHVQHQRRRRRLPPASAETPELRDDSDTNGALSLDEFKAGAPKGPDSTKSEELFKAIDSDSDGSVTKEESDAFKAKAEKAQQTLQSFLFGLQSDAASQTASTSESDDETDIFAQLDANSDGSIAKDEFLSALSSGTQSSNDLLSKLFEAIDSDSDGSVTEEEQSSFQSALEKRGPPSGASFGASQAYGSTYQLGASNASGAAYSQAA